MVLAVVGAQAHSGLGLGLRVGPFTELLDSVRRGLAPVANDTHCFLQKLSRPPAIDVTIDVPPLMWLAAMMTEQAFLSLKPFSAFDAIMPAKARKILLSFCLFKLGKVFR